MTQQKPRAALLAIAAAVLLIGASDGLRAATAKDDSVPKATASALDVVPADALYVMVIRVGENWNHPLGKAGRTIMENGNPASFPAFHDYFGVAADEVDQLIVFTPVQYGNNSVEPLFVVKTTKPYNKNAVPGPAAENGAEEEINDRTLYRNKRGIGFSFLDDNTFLMGQAGQMTAFLKHKKKAMEGPLAPALKLAMEKHSLVVGLNTAALAAKAPPAEQFPPTWKPYKSLLKAKLITLTVDLDDQLRADVKATFTSENDAKDGAAAFDDALDLVRGIFVAGVKQLTQEIDAPKTVAFLKNAQAALRAIKTEQKGNTVEVVAAMKIDPDASAAAVTEMAVKFRETVRRIQVSNDFKQLVLAWMSYRDANGSSLMDVYDKNGKPMLSWRVLLLPYVEQGPLYQEFHLDEPWDSEHNKKLLAKMPEVFAPKDTQAYKNHETFLQAFVGKGTVFEPPAKPKPGQFGNGIRPNDITDGTHYTLLFVEAKKSVPWTKPEDVAFDDGKLLPKVGGMSKGGFFAAMCDGVVQFVPQTVKEETLRLWIIRNSGEAKPDLDK